MQKSRSFHFRKMFEIPGRHIHGLFDRDHDEEGENDKVYSKSFESRSTSDHPWEVQPIGFALNNDLIPAASSGGEGARMPPKPPSGIFTLYFKSSQDCAWFYIAVKSFQSPQSD